MLSDGYRAFFAAAGDTLDATAHSHHPWPDVTREAHQRYWDDSARLTNRKWQERVFGAVVPEAQGHVARHLGLPDPGLVAFAPNTHEFVARLYSCLDWSRRPRVLTSGSEFHSFARQTRRLEETGRLEVVRVPAEPYASFHERFGAALAECFDLVFVSQVFFDSGFVVERLEALLAGVPPDTLVAVDGYHAFMAIPVALGTLAPRIFYLAGGYKYVQAGEGACFMSLPAGCTLRPAFTGWYSDAFGAQDLSPSLAGGQPSGAQGGAVGYGEGAMRFWGSTFDASGLYRFNAVMGWLASRGVGPREIHAHVAALQRRFLDALARAPVARLPLAALTPPDGLPRGNFLTFELDDAADAERRLAAHRIAIDRRGRRLRFGFGVYHDHAFVDRLLERLRGALE